MPLIVKYIKRKKHKQFWDENPFEEKHKTQDNIFLIDEGGKEGYKKTNVKQIMRKLP